MKTKIYRFVLLMTIVTYTARPATFAQVSSYKAYSLFVYNFTKYVQWPDGAIKNEFIIGVFGKSPVQDELKKIAAEKKAGDKTFRIIEITADKLSGEVHILFIPNEMTSQISKILAALKGRPVLLVAEREGAVQKGACISFIADHDNLKFELNSSSIAAQNLKVSKTLEALAFKNPSL